LRRIDKKLRERERLAGRYIEMLGCVPGVKIPASRPNTLHARHLFPVFVDADERDRLITEFNARHIGAVVNYRAIHLLKYFRETLGYRAGDFPIAEKIGAETISLPFYPTMPIEFLNIVVEALASLLPAALSVSADDRPRTIA
ncbi:MAG TPA: DegT/DnrJ/EryC1/StrS family aminotransferase, partial [Methylocella sp.]|nr:DegT/DnrJ/EryC1/StrS family aminotransferase [Methylocella sp.]